MLKELTVWTTYILSCCFSYMVQVMSGQVPSVSPAGQQLYFIVLIIIVGNIWYYLKWILYNSLNSAVTLSLYAQCMFLVQLVQQHPPSSGMTVIDLVLVQECIKVRKKEHLHFLVIHRGVATAWPRSLHSGIKASADSRPAVFACRITCVHDDRPIKEMECVNGDGDGRPLPTCVCAAPHHLTS